MPDIYHRLYPLVKTILILLLFFLIIRGLYIAQAFFIPLTFSAILAMLLTPLSRKFEAKGMGRGLATVTCISLLVMFFIALASLLSAQIASFVQDLPQFREQLNTQVNNIQEFIQSTFGISIQEAMQSSSDMGISSTVFSYLGSFTSVLVNSVLTMVYLFMFIFYRSHFKKFVLKVVPEDRTEKTRHIIRDSGNIAQQYIAGRGILIVILGALYSIGLLIVGVQHAILLSLIAALLSVIPYVGNIIGIAFPLMMGMVQGGDMWLFVGIIIVFSIVQFVESYILEPYIVGGEVNIHPFFTIVVIIAGEMIWGIAGMILAIPLVGILKIVMENIDSLKPYAFLIGDSNEETSFQSYTKKIKNRISGLN